MRYVFISLQQKEEENWTDEERKQFAEYERKVKELEEEREKYKKVRHAVMSSQRMMFRIAVHGSHCSIVVT